jgi:hypothetical protein
MIAFTGIYLSVNKTRPVLDGVAANRDDLIYESF